MGRPLNKRFFQSGTGATGFQVGCDAWFEGEGAAESAYIISQRSNSKYLCGSDVGGATPTRTEVLTLVQGEPLAAGQMQVEVTPELIAGGAEMQVDFGTGDLATLITAQDETSYDGAPATEGSFTAGDTGYTALDVITMSDGSLVTVDLAGGGTISQFTVDSSVATPLAAGANRTQISTTGSTGTGFILTPLADNEVQENPVISVALVDGGSGYFTGGTFNISVASDGGYVAGTEAVIAYTVANQVVTSVAVQSGGAGYTQSLVATTDVHTTDLPDAAAAGSEQSARIINARTVKTFEGNTYMWPAAGGTGTDDKARPEADLQAAT